MLCTLLLFNALRPHSRSLFFCIVFSCTCCQSHHRRLVKEQRQWHVSGRRDDRLAHIELFAVHWSAWRRQRCWCSSISSKRVRFLVSFFCPIAMLVLSHIFTCSRHVNRPKQPRAVSAYVTADTETMNALRPVRSATSAGGVVDETQQQQQQQQPIVLSALPSEVQEVRTASRCFFSCVLSVFVPLPFAHFVFARHSSFLSISCCESCRQRRTRSAQRRRRSTSCTRSLCSLRRRRPCCKVTWRACEYAAERLSCFCRTLYAC